MIKSIYRTEIDGLRAFAVVAVIINHFNKDILPSGYLGVDIFFVISGYVITSSLEGRESKNFWDFISGFYERRIKRILPTLAIFAVTTGFFISLFNPASSRILLSGIWSLVGVSNIYFFNRSTDYFAQSTELNPFTQTWSLGVEEQFYLLFPFLIWFSGFARKGKNATKNLFAWVVVLTSASLIAYIYFYQNNQPAAYFLMPCRFWEIATGCLVFIIYKRKMFIESVTYKLSPSLILVLIIFAMLLPIQMGIVTTISVVFLSGILLINLRKGSLCFKVLTYRPIVHIGLISYSLYLWHWSIISIAKWTIGVSTATVMPLLIIIILFSQLSYTFIERPCKKFYFGRRVRAFTFASISLIFSIISIIILQKNSRYIFTGRSIEYGENPALKLDSKYLGLHSAEEKQPQVVITGDSFSGHYVQVLDSILSDISIPGIIHIRGKGIEDVDRNSLKSNNYKYLSSVVENYLSSMNGLKLLIFSIEYQPEDLIRLKTSINYLLPKLANRDIKMLIIGPTPYFRQGMHSLCQEEWFRPLSLMNSTCNPVERKTIIREIEPYIEYLKQANKKHSNLYVYKPFNYLCPEYSKYCSPVNDKNQYLYHDANHLSLKGSFQLKDSLKKKISSLIY